MLLDKRFRTFELERNILKSIYALDWVLIFCHFNLIYILSQRNAQIHSVPNKHPGAADEKVNLTVPDITRAMKITDLCKFVVI